MRASSTASINSLLQVGRGFGIRSHADATHRRTAPSVPICRQPDAAGSDEEGLAYDWPQTCTNTDNNWCLSPIIRGNSVATRNSRLTAIRNFCRYLIRKDTTNAAEYGLIVSIPGKKGPKPDIPYLEPAEVKLLLDQSNQDHLLGLRDYVLIQFLYNTGVRVSEALSLTVDALELGASRQVRVHGKGRKDRVSPLWRSTAAHLKRYIARWRLGAESRLFCNGRRHPLTTSGVSYILKKSFEAAKKKNPILRKRKITPHVMRHSCACALLQSGVDLVTVRNLLGHESVRTTNRYTKSNMNMKRQALDAFWKTVDLSEGPSDSWTPKPELLEILASL